MNMFSKLAPAVLVGLILSAVFGSAQEDQAPAPSTPASTNAPIQPALELAHPGTAAPRVGEIQTAVPPPRTETAAVETAPKLEGEKGPLSLDHELPAAIQFLARSANVNIHIDPSVTFTNAATLGPDGRPVIPVVSVRWDNVSAEDALNEILDIHGLILVPNPKTGISRVSKKPTLEPLLTTIIQLEYSNPTNISELITATLSDSRSKVAADIRTSQLVLVSTESEIESVTNLVFQLDKPTKQVLIEARLLETSNNPKSIRGIDWSGTLEGQNVSFGNGRTVGTTTTQTPGQPSSTTLPSGRNVNSTPGSSTSTELVTDLGFGGISANTLRGLHPAVAFLNADGLNAVLSFLNRNADTEVVALPRQVTSDNQTATLSVTRAFPIFEITPGSAQSPPTAKITYTNLGTILKVTPRISSSSNIALKVTPEVSNIDSKDRQIINGSINEANVYAIRRMETEVVIPSGNTLVMGGLISDTATKSYTKVPILGDLPGIGLLFRRESKERTKSNLIIFVTPTIVESTDFQETPTDYLKTKPTQLSDHEESAWDTGKPLGWNKPVK